MSDNVTKLQKWNPQKKRLLLLGIAAAAVVLILLAILFPKALNLDAFGRWLRYSGAKGQEGYGMVAFDAHSSSRFSVWDSGLALVSVGGVESFAEDGTRLVQKPVSMAAPAMEQGDKITLCYDVGGSAVLALKDGKQFAMESNVDGVLFDADISAGDAICTAASESGHKTVLRVYDKDQKEIYRWFSASQFMPKCAVSPKGKHLAAVALGQKDGNFESTLYLFRTDWEEPRHTLSLDSGLVYDLRFVEENRLCVVQEDAVTWVSTSGDKLGSYDLSSWYLQEYDLSGDGFAMLSLNMYKAGDRCTVATVDHEGNRLGSLFVGADVLDISACGKYAAILTTEKLTICYKDLTEYVTVPNSWMATEVLMRPDGTAYLMTANTADLYIP